MRKEPGIRKRLMQLHLFIISLTVFLLECVFFFSIYQYYYKNTEQLVSSHAQNSANFVTRFTDLSPYNLKHAIPEMINEFQMQSAEMQIISPSGTVLASSTGFLTEEIIDVDQLTKASIEQPGIWKGRNEGTNERVMASVVPINFEGHTVIYFRYIISLSHIDKLVQQQGAIAIVIGMSIICIVLLLSKALATKITTPLARITEASKRFAKGDFDTSINESYIGELGTLAKSFNEMSYALIQNEKLKDQFVSSISHELRTPLTSIKGWSETLVGGSLNNREEMEIGLCVITKETERLIDLVEELLDFSRMNNEMFHIEPFKFEMEPLIQEITSQFYKQLKKKNIDLVVHVPEEIEVVADRNRIKQVLINILDNAIKYSNANGAIHIDCSITGNYFTVTVEDFGVGIKSNDLPNIFTPFYKPNDHVTGVGLGLAISKLIVELHHGQLSIESTEGNGTKVTFSIPID